jgi:hypothetical protein
VSSGGGITSGPDGGGGGGGGSSAGGAGQVQGSDGAGGFTAPARVLAGADYVQIGALPATVGSGVRLANTFGLHARNAGNTANVPFCRLDGGDACHIGDSTLATAVSLDASGYCYLNAPATYLSGGAAHAGSGDLRCNNVVEFCTRDAANSADLIFFLTNASDEACYNGPIAYDAARTYDFIYYKSRRGHYFLVSTSTVLDFSYGIEMSSYLPIVGPNAHSVHGGIVFDFLVDADYSTVVAQYKFDWVEFTNVGGFWTAGHAVLWPAPVTPGSGYYKTITNSTAFTMTISTGVGTTRTLATSLSQRFWFDDLGVRFAGPTFTA